MDIREFRDKTMTFLVPVLVASLVLGGIAWIVGTKYFWNTSTLTLLTDIERPVSIRIDMEAQIIKKDIPIPGLLHYAMTLLAGGKEISRTYPLHFSLPWSQSVTCRSECVISDIPSGDASLFVNNQFGGVSKIDIVVLPDTSGTMNLRPKIQIEYVWDMTKLRGLVISPTEADAIPGSIVFTNIFQSIALVRSSQGEYIYDINTRQLIRLPDSLDNNKIAPAESEGTYFLITRDAVYLYDRFGRTSLKKLESYEVGDVLLTWKDKYTELASQKESIKLNGHWWPLKKEGKTYFTDGVRVFFVK